MLKNRTKELLRNGKVAFGTMVRTFTTPSIVPLCATSGWDYVVVDTEHCAWNPETFAQFCLTASYESMTLLVRVPEKGYHLLAQPLDYGANGLVIPHVETADQARSIIDSTKYYPLGQRGASTASVSLRFPKVSAREYIEWANRETLIVVQIETETGVENADRLLAIEGIDAVMIGPFDLSQSLGIPGETSHPRVMEACRHVIDCCRQNNVASGIHVQSFEAVEQWVKEGMRFITFRYDMKFFHSGSSASLSRLREISGNLGEN